jgi:hypothetical protein
MLYFYFSTKLKKVIKNLILYDYTVYLSHQNEITEIITKFTRGATHERR